jgi:hypothetical protein
MELIYQIFALVVLMAIAMYAITIIIKAVINLLTIKKYGKAVDGVHHIEGSGFAVNRKTKKLTPSSSKVILPF